MRPHLPSLAFLFLLVTFVPISLVSGQVIFVVNSTDDPGDGVCNTDHCTLAEALEAANATAASDTIGFDIPGDGPHTIHPAGAFPDIVSPLYVDGYSQPGAAPATDNSSAVLLIELDGQNAAGDAHGVWIDSGIGNRVGRSDAADRNVISGNANAGIYINSPNGTNGITNNYIGTDATGQNAVPNHFGIEIQNSPVRTG